MTQAEFVTGLEMELRLRGVPLDRSELETFAQDVWSLAEENSDIVRWAEAFQYERQRTEEV